MNLNAHKIVNGTPVHTLISKDVNTLVSRMSKDTKVPKCVIFNHILTEGLKAAIKAKPLKVRKAKKKVAAKKAAKK